MLLSRKSSLQKVSCCMTAALLILFAPLSLAQDNDLATIQEKIKQDLLIPPSFFPIVAITSF